MNDMKIWLGNNLDEKEVYAGLILLPDFKFYHVILMRRRLSECNWNDAMKWAASIGGDLPTRREQSLLFANCKEEEFEPRWYWSNEQYAVNLDYAWLQDFEYASQFHDRKSNEHKARAVRRIYLES